MPDYFAQDQYKSWTRNGACWTILGDAAPRSTNTELRTLLGCFLFSDDDVFKKIGVLSGGERNRYALARIAAGAVELFVARRATNHLDMRAKDVLLDSLSKYSGTVVFVSQRTVTLIDNLADRIFEIEEGHVHVYPGITRIICGGRREARSRFRR